PVAAYFNRLSKILHPSDAGGKFDEKKRQARNKAMIGKLWPKAEEQYVSKSIPTAYLDKLEQGRRQHAEYVGKEFIFDRASETQRLIEAQRERLKTWFDYLLENKGNYDPAFLYYV